MTALYLAFSYFSLNANTALAGGGHEHGAHDHGGGHEDEPAKGPHGGRLLSNDDAALEITIFEEDVPPQFRVYPFKDGKPISPAGVEVVISLTRFGGKVSEFKLTPLNNFLSSQQTVEEPHSFDVRVSATIAGKESTWKFSSHEGRTELSSEALKIANVSIEIAGPQEIANVTDVYGRLIANQDRVAHIVPRFPGVVRSIRKGLGDRVEQNEVLAIIESNQSLQPYELRSQVAGEVISRHLTAGEFVSGSEPVFVVADLSEIWADFQVYRDDFGKIEKGQVIRLNLGQDSVIQGKVSYVSPIIDEVTQSKLVRAVLPNTGGNLRPGLFVSGTLENAITPVLLAVRREAIQTFRDWNVVYLTDGYTFQAMPVELGRRDTKFVEVLSGISPGDRYVARNSFIIKADTEKSGATHDH